MILNLKAAAQYIGVSPHSLRTWYWQPPRAGRPPLRKAGRRWVTTEDEILAWDQRRLASDQRQHNRPPGLARLKEIKTLKDEVEALKRKLQAVEGQASPFSHFGGVALLDSEEECIYSEDPKHPLSHVEIKDAKLHQTTRKGLVMHGLPVDTIVALFGGKPWLCTPLAPEDYKQYKLPDEWPNP